MDNIVLNIDREHDEDQVTVDDDSAQGRQDEGGEDRLGHLDEVSQGGRADGQAAVRHQSSVGSSQVIYCG